MHALAFDQAGYHSEGRTHARPGAGMITPGTGPNGHADMIGAIAAHADRQAFADLFEYFAPRVKSYMLRLGAEPQLAEELAQETLLSVWRKAAAFDRAKAAPSTWIFTIARNLRIDAARRGRKSE